MTPLRPHLAALEARRDLARAHEVPAGALLDSTGMREPLRDAQRLAGMAGAPVLLQGERGSGLLELARFIHEEDLSSRHGQFRVLPGRLVGQPVPFAKAKTGTLLIEDFEALTPLGHEWLTTLLAERSTAARRFRVIAASRLAVAELLTQPTLSEELVLMLDVGRIVVTPLRERLGDIMELARGFLAHCAAVQGRSGLRFSREAENLLHMHSYPGNVVELRNVVERAVVLESSDEIQKSAIVFHEELQQHAISRLAAQATARRMVGAADRLHHRLPTFSEVERQYLTMLIRELGGRRTDISRVMGVSYPTVLKKIALHGLVVRSILTTPTP